MSKIKASTKPVFAPSPRKFGEALQVPLSIAEHRLDPSSKARQFSYTVDLDHAPTPAFRFVCDAIGVRVVDGDCRFLFGQRNIVEQEHLRALLVVHMSAHMTTLFSRSITTDSTFDYVNFEPFEPRKEPIEVRSVEAVYVKAQGTSDSGVLDFFYVSPFELSSMTPQSTSLAIEAVVRVQVRPRLYHSFLRFVKSNLNLETHSERV